MNEYDGTNPILDALGDLPIIRKVSILNKGVTKKVEPCTGVYLLPGQTIEIRVTGEVAFKTIKQNIDQLNILNGNNIECVSEIVEEDEPD
ncbi:hypothetical protein [Acinetobacter sp. TUM15131]|uniref:hypothetical protein n=1 Tax=Acinetobacter sp. TUM15131 TaxID=2609141 RepID=UPI00124C0B1A|nr:hypothetical protein [Acinetobacter sp. TUM15131]